MLMATSAFVWQPTFGQATNEKRKSSMDRYWAYQRWEIPPLATFISNVEFQSFVAAGFSCRASGARQ